MQPINIYFIKVYYKKVLKENFFGSSRGSRGVPNHLKISPVVNL